MQKIKKPLSIILTLLMLVTMIPFSSLTVSAGEAQLVGDFVLWTGVEGTDFKYENGVLTVLTGKHLIIQNQNSRTTTTDRIYVAKDVSAYIEMLGVKIDVSQKGVPAFEIAEGSTGNVTINLGLDVGIGSVGSDFVERSKNYLKSGYGCAGLQKNSDETYRGLFDQTEKTTGKLTIYGLGYLTAIGGECAAGIGGAFGKSSCNIEIAGGTVDAIATDSGEEALWDGIGGGAGIGGGPSNSDVWVANPGGSAANITISGGWVTATGAGGANAIGIGSLHRGDIGYCKNISITGGYVELNAGYCDLCVGGAKEEQNHSITGGTVWMNSYSLFPEFTEWTTNMSYNNCIVYHDEKGQVYGNYTPPYGHLVEAGQILTIPKGTTLTIPKDTKLTNHGTIIKEGNLVINGDIVCNGHNYVDSVCTKCFKPCAHSKYTNGFCADCGKVTEEIKYNTANNYYEISNAGELLLFSEKTQSESTINAVLTADITLNEGTITADSTGVRSWTPIDRNYAGTFDGNGYSISGLYLKSSDNFQGFVRSLSSNGTVKNLTIKNSYFSGTQYTGGITGNNSGTVDNCHVSAIVNGTEDVGGVVGFNSATVVNCSNAGTVTGSSSFIGGIIGYHISDTEIINCHNSATVTGSSSIGGIAGRSSALITKCSNSGKISATNDDVGGITGIGTIYDGSAISYCSNTGYVTGRDFVGGILGLGHDTPITNCYSTGTVIFNENGPGQFCSLGSIVGNNNSFSAAINCYYLDTAVTPGGVFNIDYKGHTEEATIDQFKSGEIAYRLNGTGEKVWHQTIGTDELPQFKGDKVYYGYTSCSDSAKIQYTNTSTASATKPNHVAKTVANCKDLAVCKNCGESYGKVDSNNHKSNQIYNVYYDSTYHKSYHSCCDALIGTKYHNTNSPANCTNKNHCIDCESDFGSINANNHTGNFTWTDNGDGTHSKKWDCCNVIEKTTKAHSLTFTADDKNNVISARCSDCGYEGSISIAPPVGDLIYNSSMQYSKIDGEIQGEEYKNTVYRNGELYGSSACDAGKYKETLTIGGKSVSIEYEIKKKELTVRELWVADKDFDGTRKMRVYDVYFDGLMLSDDIEANCENAYTFAPSNRVGDYTTVSGLTGVTVDGRDMKNYIIPEISEDVEYPANYTIYPYDIRIVPEHQYITDASKLDKTKFTVESVLPEGYVIKDMAVALEGEQTIVVDDSNAKVMYGNEDFTDCFYFNTYYTAEVVICCEGHISDENGFCSTGTCSAYEPAKVNNNGTPDEDYDDYYEISNAGQLFWFAKQVNGYGNQYATVKLTADIDLNPGYTFNSDGTYKGGSNPRVWEPIGYGDGYTPYTGMFDGNGHTISGMYINTPDDNYVGMFGGCDYSNTIKNLKLTNSYFSGNSYVGAIAGYAGTTFDSCYIDSTVTVKSNSHKLGGLVGELAYNSVQNSLSFANVIGKDGSGDLFVGTNYGEVINCYYSSDSTVTTKTNAIAKTDEEFASGEVAYLLQAGILGEDIYDDDWNYIETIIPHVWGQKIGVDAYPVIGGEKVYYGYKDCNATKKTYCNNNAYDEIPTHNFESGKCTICGDKDPNVKLVSITGDITLVLEETYKDIFTGAVELEAGTYSFNVDDNGIIRGENSTYTNTATINYSADVNTPTKLKATGGKYTFTYNASIKSLRIEPIELSGDVNGDSNISVSDVIFVMKHIVGEFSLDDKQFFCADMDSNGRITLVDVLNIQKMILEMV